MADRTQKGGRLTAFDPGAVAQAVRGLFGRTATTRGDPKRLLGEGADFFGPGTPVAPAAPQAAGRRFDYPTNINTVYQPRSTEPIGFWELRGLAEYSLVRLAIETRKDQMGKLAWVINRKDGNDQDATAKRIQDALDEPDGINDFATWQRMVMEEMLVTDATSIYLRPGAGGVLLEPIDGATIHPVIDAGGREPVAGVAYQQKIKGLPAVDYTRDELVYYPRNRRVHKLYGYSPVEQIIMIINIGLRREVSQLQAYTEGNIPEMLMGVPQEWSEQQIASYQAYFDELLAGDTAARRRIRFVPGDAKPMPVRSESIFDPFDEWLARVVCYAFNLPPNAFVKQQNRATAENAQEIALEEGLAPVMLWFERLMNRLIRKAWKTTDYVFAWQDAQDVDPMVQMQIDVGYCGGPTGNGPKIRSVQEIRDDHDWGPLPAELKAESDAKLEAIKNPPPAPGGGGDPNDSVDPNPQDGANGAGKMKKRRSLQRRY